MVEGSAEVAGGGDAVLFFHATHLHAHVTGFDNNHDTQGFQGLLDGFLDLKGHALLHLQAMTVDVDYTGYLGESGDVAVGDVGHVYLTIEGQHVVFAEREEVDVLNDDHLTVVFLEQRIGQYLMSVHAIASGEHLHGLGHAQGCLLQPFAGGVFAKQLQDVFIVSG